MGKARQQEKITEEEIKNAEVPENAEEITEEEAKKLEEEAIAKVEPEAEAETEEEEEEPEKEVIYEIHTPNKSYTGLNCAVEFKDGVGRTNVKVLAEHFIQKGYEVKEI